MFFNSKRLVSFNSKHIGKVYGLTPYDTLIKVDYILNEESSAVESVLLINHLKTVIMSTKINDL